MAATSVLRPMVQLDVPGCPAPLIDRAISIAARDWCDLTQSAKELVSITAIPGVQSYEIELESATFDIARVSDVSFAGEEIDPLAGNTTSTALNATGGIPAYYWIVGSTLWFDAIPQSAADILLQVAVKPRIDSPTIPDSVASGEAALAISYRAKRELMMSKQPWGDVQMAAWFDQEFQRLSRNGISVGTQNVTNARIRTTPIPD